MTVTRAQMGAELALSPSSPTKTYVVEVHAEDPAACLRDLSTHVEPTADAFLFRVHTEAGIYWVDQLDERFWRFHTDMRKSDAYPHLKDWVGSRRDLDWMWLPSEHLHGMWPGARSRRVRTDFHGGSFIGNDSPAQDLRVQLSGRNAEQLFDRIGQLPEYRSAISFDAVELEISETDFGYVREGVNRMGSFAASGDSLELHLDFVNVVVGRYKRLVELCEEKAIKWSASGSADGGGTVQGGPILITFSREIENLEAFAEELTSCREPFRLWGAFTTSRGIVEVEAVDLHVAQTLQFDIAKTWMRVYLQEGSCGNTVARLISNLQHRFDGALNVADPQIEQAIRGR